MTMLDTYLDAVAAQLPRDTRDDIVAELRDTLLNQFEEREADLGRPLTDDEREDILRAMGHPLVVAARYGKGPQSLIGPELYPYWLFAVKAGLFILLAVQAVGLIIHLVSGTPNFGQSIAQAFHGFFGSALTLIGVATVAGAVLEWQGIRPEFLTKWKVKDLAALRLSDPANWAAGMSGADLNVKPSPHMPRPVLKSMPGSDALWSVIAGIVFVLWWTGALQGLGVTAVSFGREDMMFLPDPIWAGLFTPILAYALSGIAIDLLGVVRPDAIKLRALFKIPLAAAGLWLASVLYQARDWFTLSQDGMTVVVGPAGQYLTPDAWSRIDAAGSDVNGAGLVLSIMLTWVLAFVALSLVVSILLNLWRLVRPARRAA
ncbi:HAAS signaling domain-containing protein [Brevundimonas sp.]|uniref:HAAS signaling domain-containing protein n=1 Tax=Brevundimonas sp. TaxID=1871086 RepID=UPI002AB9ED6A|nr:hypothetical protein [Brevundimonas sp.]MDZ4364630.1 hypothetical protein [Brevundimonas sp.]